MAPYCTNCGSSVADHDRYCSSCGQSIKSDADNQKDSVGDRSASSRTPDPRAAGVPESQRAPPTPDPVSAGDRQAYLATVGGALVFVLLGIGSLLLAPPETASEEVPGPMAYAFLAGVIGYLASIVTLYVDLQSFDEPVWNPRVAVWIPAAVFLYLIVILYYVYKRRKRLRAA